MPEDSYGPNEAQAEIDKRIGQWSGWTRVLHVYYAGIEAIKIAALLVIGVMGTLVHAPRKPAPASAATAEPATTP